MRLTIVIPSYKRSEYLRKLLRALTRELTRNPSVDALVVLDPSGDGSEEVLRRFSVPWIVNEKRIGFTESVIKGIGVAKGDYIWMVGDDDIIEDGAVSLLVDSLRNDPVLLISRPFETTAASYSSFRLYVAALSSSPMLIEDLHLAARVFRKELFLEETARAYADTLFGHAYAVVHGLSNHGNQRVDVIDERLFRMLPQSRRPLWHDFPKDLDKTLDDYLMFLSLTTGVDIDPDLVLKRNREAFSKSLRNPFRFVLDHWRAIFSPQAWRYAFARFGRIKPVNQKFRKTQWGVMSKYEIKP